MSEFPELLSWITTGGSVAVVSWFVSWLLEDFHWWQVIKSQYKRLLILLVALGLGSSGQYLALHPEAMQAVQPYLDTGVMVITAWLATQVAHRADGAK